MTPEEYKQLDILLAKLCEALGRKKYCLIPGYHHDGPYMAVYSENDTIEKQGIYIDIESGVKALTSQP